MYRKNKVAAAFEHIALSIGSNCGDRLWYMERMVVQLREVLESRLDISVLMETEPLEVAGEQSWYLNRIIGGRYRGTPEELLSHCRSIEEALGRTGKGLRKPRTADVDILLFGNVAVTGTGLTLPHPGILRRRFCLEGLVQIMPDTVIATTGKTVREHHEFMEPMVRSQQIRFVVPQGDHHGD
jgi:2-amino-4-hydroxy-6-hydroxymethyldihydropteridine diphosphokinase